MQKQIYRILPVLFILSVLVFAPVLKGLAQEGVKEVPERTDIEKQYLWNLGSIYPTVEDWENDYNLFENSLTSFEEYKGKLGESAENLLQVLKLRDSIESIGDNLYVYANMLRDQDTRDNTSQEMADRIGALYSQYGSATSYIVPEILKIDPATLQKYLKENKELQKYSFYFEKLLKSKEHILSPEEEKILALAGPVLNSPTNVFSMIDNADIKYGIVTDEDGNDIELTKQRYSKLLKSTNRAVRREAARVYNEAYLSYVNTLGANLAGTVNGDWFLAQARDYKTCLDMALDRYYVPSKVFRNLIDAVNANLEPLHKWTAIRKKALGLDTMYTFDMSVPLMPEYEKEYTYDEAQKTVINALKPLGDEYINYFINGLNSRWIDVYETKGKRSGAYSWGSYSSQPFVLFNFSGNFMNLFTLAHEMGHSMNSFYTHSNEPFIYSNNYTFNAEVASTLNESLLIRYLLDRSTDRKEKIYLLEYYIDQIVGTFYFQTLLSELELTLHERVEQGGAISANFVRETYRNLMEKYYGPDMVIPGNMDMGGLRIGHLYWQQFYIFQYATSYAAAQDISQRILKGEKGAVPAYLEFLKTGSSKYPVDVLKIAGVDMTAPDAIQNTINLMAELVDEMDRLLNES